MNIFIISPFLVHLAGGSSPKELLGKINGLMRVTAPVAPGLIFCQGLVIVLGQN
jgi:hypothetical protein